jgi:hypothetical protein
MADLTFLPSMNQTGFHFAFLTPAEESNQLGVKIRRAAH